jgi:tetratricopeptide (TPR) repeat protein
MLTAKTARTKGAVIGLLVACLIAGSLFVVGCGQKAPKEGDTVFAPKPYPNGFDQAWSKAQAIASDIREQTPPDPLSFDSELSKSERDSEYFEPSGVDEAAVRIATTSFEEGNWLYQIGEYSQALDQYDEALRELPYHYGARNNRALTLLQLDRTEEALTDALVVLELYPESVESYLNAQVATYACGYPPGSLSSKHKSVMDSIKMNSQELQDAVEYNYLYATMEYMNPENKKAAKDTYSQYLEALEALVARNPQDSDMEGLRGYLEGIGMVTGLTPYPKKK